MDSVTHFFAGEGTCRPSAHGRLLRLSLSTSCTSCCIAARPCPRSKWCTSPSTQRPPHLCIVKSFCQIIVKSFCQYKVVIVWYEIHQRSYKAAPEGSTSPWPSALILETSSETENTSNLQTSGFPGNATAKHQKHQKILPGNPWESSCGEDCSCGVTVAGLLLAKQCDVGHRVESLRPDHHIEVLRSQAISQSPSPGQHIAVGIDRVLRISIETLFQ